MARQKHRDQNIATHIWYVRTLATEICHFQTFATEKLRRDFRDRKTQARLLRPRRIRRDPRAQETARPALPSSTISRRSRPRWRRCDFYDQGGYGATQETAQLDATGLVSAKLQLQDFRDRGGHGATFQTNSIFVTTFWYVKTFATHVRAFRDQAAQLSRSEWRRRNFPYQGGDGATFQTEAETVLTRNNSLRPWWMRSDLSNQSGDCPHQGGYGAIFQTTEKVRSRINFPRPRRRRQDFPDEGGDGASFQTNAETAQPRINSSRPRRRRII